jgi:Skp family chaperone for outer membrane proteins
MNEQNPVSHVSQPQARSRFSQWIPILGVGIVAAGGAMIFQSAQTKDLRQQFVASQKDNAALQAKLSQTDSELRQSMDTLKNQLDQTREDAATQAQQAQGAASRQASSIANRLAKKEEERNRLLAEELDHVKASSLETSGKLEGITTDVGSVKTDLGSVRTDVASAKSDIEDTKSDLQRARGDLGAMSGLIATNSKEIQMLRDLGDRNIYEFTIAKTGAMQKVGDIQVVLRKADVKHNRFTLDVLADDKRVEKKDRTVNEPVQFYTSNARQPYELVVNQVSKDKIVGYLATPKVMVSRNQAAQ